MAFFKRPRPSQGYGHQDNQSAFPSNQDQEKERDGKDGNYEFFVDYNYPTTSGITNSYSAETEQDNNYGWDTRRNSDSAYGNTADNDADYKEEEYEVEDYNDSGYNEHEFSSSGYSDIDIQEIQEEYTEEESAYKYPTYLPPENDISDTEEIEEISEEIKEENQQSYMEESKELYPPEYPILPEEDVRTEQTMEYPSESELYSIAENVDDNTEEKAEEEKTAEMPERNQSVEEFVMEVAPKAKPGGRDENGEYYRPKYPVLNKLKRIRTERQVTQKVVANYLGITVQYYSQIERGLNILSYLNAVRLAIFFECHVDDLFLDDYSKGYEDIESLRYNMTKRGRRKKGRQHVE